MAIDATAREANVRDSIKKYFIDGLKNTDGIETTFDISLHAPTVQGITVDRWVSIVFGSMDVGAGMSELILNIYCATRRDGEGFKLAQLRDKVMNYLSDTSQTDGMARIALYRSRADGNWTQLDGGFVVSDHTESGELEAPDETKYKIITATLRWAAKM